LLKKKLSQQNLGLFSVMAAKKPDLTVKNGIFWLKFGIQRVKELALLSHSQLVAGIVAHIL